MSHTQMCCSGVFLKCKKPNHCAVLLVMHEWLHLAEEQNKCCFSSVFQLYYCSVTPSSNIRLQSEMESSTIIADEKRPHKELSGG